MDINSGVFKMFNNSFSAHNGANLFSKTADGHNDPHGAIQAPQYYISSEKIFESDVLKDITGDWAKDSVPCLWVEIGLARLVTHDSSGQLTGDGRVVTQDPMVCMKYGTWAPILEARLFEGEAITKIEIRRTSNIAKKVQILQLTKYNVCHIKTFKQAGDTITFTFNYESMGDVSMKYTHDGSLKGNTAVTYSVKTLKVGDKEDD
jgi:hypothetical protein